MAKYCAVLTNTDRKLLKHLPGEDENSLRGLIGIWMERNPNRETDHPSLEEIKSLISQLRDSKGTQLDKYIHSSGIDSGFLTPEGEELLSSTFYKDKFNKGTTKVSLYPGSSGTEIRIDFKSQKNGKDYYVIYHGSPTRRVWDMYNSEGGSMTNVNSEQYWKNIRTVVPKTLLDLVESGRYAELDNTPTSTDELGSIVYSTGLIELFEKEYNVLKQGRNTAYNTSIIQKALNILGSSAEEGLDDALLPPPTAETTSFDTTSFETTPVSSLSEQRAVDLVFDPTTRRDRVTLLSRLFSTEVDAVIRETKNTINRRMMEEELTEKQR